MFQNKKNKKLIIFLTSAFVARSSSVVFCTCPSPPPPPPSPSPSPPSCFSFLPPFALHLLSYRQLHDSFAQKGTGISNQVSNSTNQVSSHNVITFQRCQHSLLDRWRRRCNTEASRNRLCDPHIGDGSRGLSLSSSFSIR